MYHATKVYRLNFVSPKIVENIVNGTAPRDLRLQDIFAKKALEIWQEQEEMWGVLISQQSFTKKSNFLIFDICKNQK